jgi:hypothetical protein
MKLRIAYFYQNGIEQIGQGACDIITKGLFMTFKKLHEIEQFMCKSCNFTQCSIYTWKRIWFAGTKNVQEGYDDPSTGTAYESQPL